MKIAAIDIGSNAARLLVVDAIVDKQRVVEFNKLNFVRLPIGLGFDVFETGAIGKERAQMFVKAMQAFQEIIRFYDVKIVKACATSAMRDANNGPEVARLVEQKSGLRVHIISGDEEATLVHDTHIAENMDREHGYLYINVGGGSTDIIFYEGGKMRYKQSFNVGTIRLLKDLVEDSLWDSIKAELKTRVKSTLPLVAIGSGGNINKLFTLSKKKEGKPLPLDMLKLYYEDLSLLSIEERIHLYHFREDRAKVIVPALKIYINMMRWTGIKLIYVPKIGLVDGLVRDLYQEAVNK